MQWKTQWRRYRNILIANISNMPVAAREASQSDLVGIPGLDQKTTKRVFKYLHPEGGERIME